MKLRIIPLLMLVTFFLSCTVPNELKNAGFKSVSSYSICSALYWGEHSADVDWGYIKNNYCGKTINTEVWKQTDDLNRDFYYIVIPKYIDLALTVIKIDKSYYFVDYKINPNLVATSKLLMKNFKLEVPQDWLAVAKGTGEGIDKEKTFEVLKTTLKSFVAPNRKAIHHFYIGQFTEFDSLLHVYDVENKELIYLPAPMNNNYHDLLNPRSGQITTVPIEFTTDGKTIASGWEKTFVDNCKTDGTLIEVN